jgi:hypothetical protein
MKRYSFLVSFVLLALYISADDAGTYNKEQHAVDTIPANQSYYNNFGVMYIRREGIMRKP